MLLRNARVF